MVMAIVGLVFAVFVLFWIFLVWKAQIARIQFINSYPYQNLISPKLREKLSYLDDSQWPLVIKGLRQYFRICHKARGRMVAMPSEVVDDLWHEFILDTRAYQSFCKKSFGRFLHHVPAQGMSSPTIAQEGIKRAWRLSCSDEYINPLKPSRLPLLFAIDSLLKVPGGFFYSLDCMDKKEGDLAAGCNGYCATHIGCSSGCGGGASCGGGCGGD